ncbi:MAG: lysophospholipid acyltransferase family protein [Xanthomonadaceae bacterium]|nr:lysophospholipid acyltransferase family protein [Xanthomonadaceae bacterium]
MRKFRRALAGWLFIGLSGWASRSGPARIRSIGRAIGLLHYWLSWPVNIRLRHDMARALGVSLGQAAAILRQAHRENDRAVFEILCLAHADCKPAELVDPVVVENREVLERLHAGRQGVILLGMHMGNGILMAARLARAGLPIHVVFRDPRRLPEGLLGRALERAGCVPVALDRGNPTRSFRQMLGILKRGGMIYILMDQGNKGEGAKRDFLGKTLRLPSGVPSLAVRTGSPVIPVHAESADPHWRFRVNPALPADDTESLLDRISKSMQRQIIDHPELWAWHHRRWKRYHFNSEPSAEP